MHTTTIRPEQVAQRVTDYILQEIAYSRPDLEIGNDLHLVEQGIIDSMGILRLIDFIEEEFDIALEPEDLMIENFSTIDAIAAFITSKQ